MRAHTHTHTHTRMHLHIHTRTHTHSYTYAHTKMHTRTSLATHPGDSAVHILRPWRGHQVDGTRAAQVARQRGIVLQAVAGAVLRASGWG